MKGKSHVNLTIDEGILRWIDTLRGQLPRSTFINKILLKISFGAKDVFDWDLEERLAQDDIKKGNVKSFPKAKDAIKWLNE